MDLMALSLATESCPTSAPFFGFMGVTSALVFANIGAAYGTAKFACPSREASFF